ncbi:MAG: tetratricopeptide repeat protein [Trueperaceae bacterium]|nr:tetratricopeptide repeat protein [Trueperaceae bacterium]
MSKQRGLALGVWGEAGIGKSFTVSQSLTGLSCQYLSLHASSSLAKLAQALPKARKLPLWAQRNLERLKNHEVLEPKDSLITLTTCLAALVPFVLYLEDIHELDPAELSFVTDLALSLGKIKGLACVVSSRNEPPEGFLSLRLEPLAKQVSDALLESELNASLPPVALSWIFERASGNPLFTLEYLNYLVRQGSLWNDGKGWHWREPSKDYLPVTVEALIEQQILQVKRYDYLVYVMEAKALLPLDAEDDLVAKVARLSKAELEVAYRQLRQQGIIQKKRFSHPLFKEVTLKLMSAERRQNLARRAINQLHEKPEQAAQFIELASLDEQTALTILKQAAYKLESSQSLSAAKFLEMALPYADTVSKTDLALKAIRLRLKEGDTSVLQLIQESMSFFEDKTKLLKALAEVHALRGEKQLVQQAVERLGSDSIEQHWLIRLYFTVGDYELLLQMLPNLDTDKLSTGEIYYLCWVLMDTGKLEQALAISEPHLLKADLLPGEKAELLDIRASALHYQGQFQAADRWFSEIIALYKEAHSSWDGVANALRNRALNRLELGLYQDVIPDFLAALKIYAERGTYIFYAQTLVMLSDVYLDIGDYDKAEDVLMEGLVIFEQVEPQSFYVHALANLALVHVKKLSPFSALLANKHAQKALDLSQQSKSSIYQSIALLAAAEVALFQQHSALAQGYVEKALELSRDSSLKSLAIKAQTLLARVFLSQAKTFEAKGLFQAAFDEAKAANMKLDEAMIGLELDYLNNDLESAKERLAWFLDRGFKSGIEAAKRRFTELAEEKDESAEEMSEIPRLEVLGKMQVIRAGQSLPVQGRKRQDCLLLLLEAKLSGLQDYSQLDLFDQLYPEKDEFAAATSLKQLVHQIRQSYGENFILRTGSGYALGTVSSDVEDFLKTGDTRLWQGKYPDLADSRLAETLYQGLLSKAEELLTNDVAEAERVLTILVHADPFDLRAFKTYLQALRVTKSAKTLSRHFNEAKKRFIEVGEALPETWQLFLS